MLIRRLVALFIVLGLGYGLFLHPRGTEDPRSLAGPGSLFLEVDGLTIHTTLREGHGPGNLILIHGFGSGTFSWEAVHDELAHWGTVVAYDRPGFGLTPRPTLNAREFALESPYGPTRQLRLLPQLMDAMGMERAVLVAHSAGAQIALETALLLPQRVDALILVAPAAGARPVRPGITRLLRHRFSLCVGPRLIRPLAYFLPLGLRRSWHSRQIPEETLRDYRKPLRVEGWDRGLWGILASQEETRWDFSAVTCPILVISGGEDRLIPVNTVKTLLEDLPPAAHVILEESGHVPHEEDPSLFLEVVHSFLRSVLD